MDSYDIESQFIREKENEILKKAKNVHEELQSLHSQKIELLCQVFREQLLKDMDTDLMEYGGKLNVEFTSQVRQVEEMRKQRVMELDRMIVNVEQQIRTFEMIIEDLRDKREEIGSAELTAVEYLKKEKQRNMEEYRQKCERVVSIKVKEFRAQISKMS